MADAVELLVRVAGWVYWLAWAAALGSAGASFLFMALGDRDRAVTLFKGSIAAVLVAAFGQTLLLSVIGALGGWQLWSAQAGQVTRYPEAGTAIYIMAFIMLLLAAVNLARGHVAEGGWMIIGSVLALAIVVFAANAFNTTVMAYGGGPLLIEARTDRLFYKPNEGVELYVTVRASGLAVDKVNVTVDWGDGSRPTKQEVPVGKETMICAPPPPWFQYDSGVCGAKYYSVRRSDAEKGVFNTIKVNATYKNLLSGSTAVTVYIRELPGLSFPFSMLGGFMNWLLGILTGGMLDPARLLYSPVFRFDGPEGAWYNRTLTLAVMLLPVFMLFRIAPGLAYNPGAAIVEGFRDAALAVVAMVLIPHAYNVTAGVLNLFTEGLAGPAGSTIIAQMAGTAATWGATFVIISLVSPGIGFLGGILLLTVLLISILGVLRWFIILAAVASSPLLVLAWLHPALRGAASQLHGLVGTLMLAGPLAAVFVNLFAEAVLGGNILQSLAGSFALSWAGVFVVGLLPQVISFLAVTGAERMVAMRLEQAATRGAPQVGKAVTAAGAKGLAAGAAVAGRAGYAQAMKVKPIADVMRAGGTMIGKAREAASRTLDRVQSGLENRMARAQRTLTRDQARLATWRELEGDFGKLATLDEAYRNAERAHADSLEYLDSLSAEERANPENVVGLFLNQAEHERLRNEREVERMLLDSKIRHLRELNYLTGDEYRTLEAGVREAGAAPALALQYARKRVKNFEEQVDVDRAQLKGEEAADRRLIDLVKWTREAPKKAWQNLRHRISRSFELRAVGRD